MGRLSVNDAALDFYNKNIDNLSAGQSASSPEYVTQAQGTVTQTTVALAAATAATALTASATRRGVRILNWTTAPVYLTQGTTGTPASDAPSDFIPAGTAGVPGVWEPKYAPVTGLRAISANAGNLTVVAW